MQIGINGFGRIGRGIFRVINADKNFNNNIKIVAIKDIISIENAAYLLKYDSLYGTFNKEIDIDGDDIIIDGKHHIKYFQTKDVSNVPWNNYEIDLLIESSGFSTSKELSYLISNKIVKKIVCTWNVPNPDTTIVCGVNLDSYNENKHNIISASTCTGNGVVPILHILKKEFGIEYGHINTIHPVLSDQKLMDSAHKNSHLGRMALNSIIPTSTSVVKSSIMLHPDLEDKLDCISYRVPTTIVSCIDLAVSLEKNTSKKEVEDVFLKYANGFFEGIIDCDYGFKEHNKVSIDFIRSSYSSIILMNYVQLTNKRFLALSLFHDNEWGYSNRVCDLINYINKVN
jgi:glyceraldehyde 3-phosphate dehydrogenase